MVRSLFGTSWGEARAWITSGKVRVGGAVVTEPTLPVARGAIVAVDPRAPRARTADLEDEAVIHVDPHVIVVAKPAGLNTVPYIDGKGVGPGASGPRGGEADALDARVRAWLGRRARGDGNVRPNLGIVHRLDRETSGLVVFTRTWLAKQSLALQFRKHTVHRRYLAIAHGDVASRTIRSMLLEDRGDGLRGSARGQPPPGAREAVTHVERLERLAGATLVGCRLETGRTHQIRIQLAEGGNPLVGERVYVRGFRGEPVEAPRLMLHAFELGFVHPATEREMRWELPIPDDMRAVLERLRATGP
ncbi:MAG: RluA family pseudouridine synthase [Myxococcales bacterium]|nr:RluA family pseudouridine synthase [Myxococcales bacterium]